MSGPGGYGYPPQQPGGYGYNPQDYNAPPQPSYGAPDQYGQYAPPQVCFHCILRVSVMYQ